MRHTSDTIEGQVYIPAANWIRKPYHPSLDAR
jgi:K+ transporter